MGPYFTIETNGAVSATTIHPLDEMEISSKKIEPSKISWINKLADFGGLTPGLFDCEIRKYEKSRIERAEIFYMGDLIFKMIWDKKTECYRCVEWNLLNLCNSLHYSGCELRSVRWCDTYEEFLFFRRDLEAV